MSSNHQDVLDTDAQRRKKNTTDNLVSEQN